MIAIKWLRNTNNSIMSLLFLDLVWRGWGVWHKLTLTLAFYVHHSKPYNSPLDELLSFCPCNVPLHLSLTQQRVSWICQKTFFFLQMSLLPFFHDRGKKLNATWKELSLRGTDSGKIKSLLIFTITINPFMCPSFGPVHTRLQYLFGSPCKCTKSVLPLT